MNSQTTKVRLFSIAFLVAILTIAVPALLAIHEASPVFVWGAAFGVFTTLFGQLVVSILSDNLDGGS